MTACPSLSLQVTRQLIRSLGISSTESTERSTALHSKYARRLTLGALLLALSLAIPLALGGTVSLMIGPFSATPASHVPVFLSMLFGPLVAGTVGFGSALGFFIRLGPIVGLRAAMHIPVGMTGAVLVKRKVPYPLVLCIVAPIHALLESLVVLIFGFSLKNAGNVVGLGTLVHHSVDSVISILVQRMIGRAIPVASSTVYIDQGGTTR